MFRHACGSAQSRVGLSLLLIVFMISFLFISNPFRQFTTSASESSSWSLIYDGRGLKAYPDLREYVWEKNASIAPNSPYDKIALHRLVKTGITPKGVAFICPEQSSSGNEYISNPSSDNITKYESQSQAIYWANRDLDVYVIDFRWNFIPNDLNASQLSFMAEWSRNTWMSDMKEAMNKVKEVSGASKVFIVGYSGGGASAINYASKYWTEDIRGIILLSPWATGIPKVLAKRGGETNTYNLTQRIDDMVSTGSWATENLPISVSLNLKYAMENPGGPAVDQTSGQPLSPTTNPRTGQPWTNVTEWVAYIFSNMKFTNIYGGYGNITLLIQHYAYKPIGDRWIPKRFALEDAAMMDWVDCPYLQYDFDDHYSEMNVPLLAFVAGYSQNSSGTFQFVNGIGSSDFTGVVLQDFGHYDIFFGPYAVQNVSEPALNWMLNRARTDYQPPAATAFCDVTVMPGWTWHFFVHSKGGIGPHSYQWYEGSTLLAGQTSMILPVSKGTAGKWTYYCKVTDGEGTTTVSNAVTLTVWAPF